MYNNNEKKINFNIKQYYWWYPKIFYKTILQIKYFNSFSELDDVSTQVNMYNFIVFTYGLCLYS